MIGQWVALTMSYLLTCDRLNVNSAHNAIETAFFLVKIYN